MAKYEELSELIWRAANENLSEVNYNKHDIFYGNHKCKYSCDAVLHATEWQDYDKIMREFEKMGLNCNSTMELMEFTEGEERQGARYLWLVFASLVFEDL